MFGLNKLSQLVMAGVFVVMSGQSLAVTITTTDNGWYNSAGDHGTTNTNTFTGLNISGLTYNSFYNFDLSGLIGAGEVVTSASITFYAGNGTYVSPDAFETLQIWDVTSVPGLGSSAAIYADLMSGSLYGQTDVYGVSNQSMPEVTVDLNAMAFADMLDGGFFSLGASLATIAGTAVQSLWYGSSNMPAAYLTFTTGPASVPETASIFLLGLGLLGFGFANRKRFS